MRLGNQFTNRPGQFFWSAFLVFFLTGSSVSLGDHWAFTQPVGTDPRLLPRSEWTRNPIDQFILAKLQEKQITPSPEAGRHTLIRRLYLDLIGLPPAPEEVQAFVSDQSPNYYERLVDELLASPHFGEQWGRHWLDLARYADSDGYEKDGIRPYAYLYRDWVIDAINADLPYDRFSIEQLAGDLLPNATLEQKVATGFHRNTLKNLEGGVDQEEFRCKAVVDRVSTTGTIWLGLTIGCAECHSHKFDPISQREFYQMFAFFNSASDYDLPLPSRNEQLDHEKAVTRWSEKKAALQRDIDQSWSQYLRTVFNPGPLCASNSPLRLADLLALEAKRQSHAKAKPVLTKRLAQTLKQSARETFVHVRGDFLRKGDRVEPETPAILHPFKSRSNLPDRLDLARWLFDPKNPLTGRVAVNQIWSHLFGRGLVRTEADFGTRGEAPTHPELLDWLATEFPRLGWSRKAMIRLIVTSATYRQASLVRPDLLDVDANNLLLARQNRLRLPAETVRDLLLSSSGLLSDTIGGPGIRPRLPADIAALGYANSVQWKESPGAGKYRRGLYIVLQRTVPYPMLATFDAPDSNTTCTRRETSNTPLQALTLLNDPAFFECAQNLPRFIKTDGGSRDELTHDLFMRCLARPPTPEEASRLKEAFDQYQTVLQHDRDSASKLAGSSDTSVSSERAENALTVALGRIVMNLDEFITRE